MDFKDGTNTGDDYAYDANGNLTKDLNKNITNIEYNVLNLPCKVTFGDGSSVSYMYAADGGKLQTVHEINGITTTTDYVGNMIYENGTLKRTLVDGGYIENDEYYFYIQDHWGNNRVVADVNAAIVQTNDYYPFGANFAESMSTDAQPYKYNGKELDTKGGLNLYDYGARHYDPVLGRFGTIDPLAEKYYSISPYAYCLNNPIKYIDPNGEDILIWYKGSNENWEAWAFNGSNHKEVPKDPYVQSLITAYNYDVENGGGDNLKNAATNKDKKFEVMETEGKSFVGYSGKDARRPILLWNSQLGLETDEKKSISPATVLEHEMDHLYKEVMTPDKDFGEYRVTTNKGTDAQYETKEERRVITGSEVKTARANKEYSRNYMRRNHGGSLIITQGPISNKKVKSARFK